MSYVIQNFYKPNYKFAITPRLRIFISLKSINFFLFFFKFKNFLILPLYTPLFGFFFNKGLTDYFYKLLLDFSGNYSNVVSATGVYWNFKILDNFLKTNQAIFPIKNLNESYFFNLYYLSIKIINMKLNKTYFKNIFFFFILFLSEIWYQFHTHIFFYLNFFFIKNNFKMYKFYNGYFLRVYNF